ncbi:DegT/DnrJ/EryC1/StrS family aminotransferase [Amylibacter sp.]|nr:DegT/DnrJ/EryC1/StrS family aminotransferase [Amylibacter sp.]MDB2393911.1 DegT/DnrJ/EryC1/StrS family aminotransferase [bacterium]
MLKPIPVNEPLLDGNEKQYLMNCIETGWISSEGPYVQAFEEKFAARLGRRHAIAVSSGSAAIDATIDALSIGPGDEVILPTFTIISCVAEIVRRGAIPVLIDADTYTWNMNVNLIEEKITSRTKAIMAVHIYGLPVDMDPVLEIAKKYNLFVIEDAAEMHGQKYNDIPCGKFGDVSIFSFYSNKHVTTGEGGMVLTDDDNLAESLRGLRNLCFNSEKRFIHERIGWNLRMTNMQAAIGLAQLERLDEFTIRKREMGRLYSELLGDLDQVQLPIKKTIYSENIYWVYGMLIKQNSKLNVSQIMAELSENKIGTRPFFYPIHQQPVLIKRGYFKSVSLPISENLYKQGFYIPSGMSLQRDDIIRVAETLRKIILS